MTQPTLYPPTETAQRARVGSDESIDDFIKRLQGNYKFRVCGVGAINNHGDKVKGTVLCTDVRLVDASNGLCKAHGQSDPYYPADGLACLQWNDRDNNVCVGDYGSELKAWKKTFNHQNFSFRSSVCLPIR